MSELQKDDDIGTQKLDNFFIGRSIDVISIPPLIGDGFSYACTSNPEYQLEHKRRRKRKRQPC